MKRLVQVVAPFAFAVASIAYAQNETVNGNLHVAGDLTVDGVAIERQSLYIGGDGDKFYPVWFSDPNWSYGEFDLQIYRPDIHANSSWKGSLLSRFRSHATRWGHGSEFVECSIRQSSTGRPTEVQHVADYKTSVYKMGIIVWLRGQSTYNYHANDREPVVTFNDSGDGYIQLQEYQGQVVESYVARDTVSEAILTNGSSISDSFKVGGKLGVGTVASNYKLEVAGTIRAEEIIVEAQPWPDYVFEDGYELPSLEETRQHILEHKRLPGMPSAEEVSEKGVTLGESQRLLLQKLEELTLHVLQQQEEIGQLRRELRAVKGTLANE